MSNGTSRGDGWADFKVNAIVAAVLLVIFAIGLWVYSEVDSGTPAPLPYHSGTLLPNGKYSDEVYCDSYNKVPQFGDGREAPGYRCTPR